MNINSKDKADKSKEGLRKIEILSNILMDIGLDPDKIMALMNEHNVWSYRTKNLVTGTLRNELINIHQYKSFIRHDVSNFLPGIKGSRTHKEQYECSLDMMQKMLTDEFKVAMVEKAKKSVKYKNESIHKF